MPTAIEELEAFVRAHASRTALPAHLYAAGEALWERLRLNPPADPRWGHLLVALGELAAERLDDEQAAARWFRLCLDAEGVHCDPEACTAAGYGQGVLWERQSHSDRAYAAYAAAASEGFRCAVIAPATLRAAVAAVRLGFARAETLTTADAVLAKQAWLGWTWLTVHEAAAVDTELTAELGRQLCAFLLPDDDPALLAGAWRSWSPHHLDTATGPWRDNDPACLRALFIVAAVAADHFLADESPASGDAYRLLAAAV